MNLIALLFMDLVKHDRPWNARREQSALYGQSYAMNEQGQSEIPEPTPSWTGEGGGSTGATGGGITPPKVTQSSFVEERIEYLDKIIDSNKVFHAEYKAEITKAKEDLAVSAQHLTSGTYYEGGVRYDKVQDLMGALGAQSAALTHISAAQNIPAPAPNIPMPTSTVQDIERWQKPPAYQEDRWWVR